MYQNNQSVDNLISIDYLFSIKLIDYVSVINKVISCKKSSNDSGNGLR
jgi:hypothetical protein